MFGLARGRGTSHPTLSRILIARMVNQALGGALVGPWDIDDLPDELIDAVQALVMDMPQYRAGVQRVESVFAKWRAQHPTYRK